MPLVILGLSVRVPGGVVDAVGYWGVLRSGVDVTSEVPEYRWGVERPGVVGSGAGEGLVRTLRGGWLGRVEGFDAAFWGISPREAAGMDPQQRLLLECAWEALEDAGLAAERLRGRRVGVYVGICASDYAQMVASGGLGGIDAYHASGTQHSVASGRIAYALGLRGGAVSVDTACSSSLVALHLASRALRNGECDLAIVGGVNLILTPLHSVGFSRAGMLSADGRCKAFSSGADGYGRAEGCAVVVLGRQGEVPAGRAWAVLRGSAVGQDGASGGLTVPNGPAQAEVIRAALADAGADAGSVGYIEAHGTGTALGDPIEAGALATVFGAGPGAGVPIGSAKANLGHAEGAAGLLGVVKAVLMRHHGEVPPHPYAGTPSEHVDWAGSGLRLPAEVEPLGAEALVGVSSFGFSGTNAHAVIGPAPAGLGRVPEAVLAAHGARQGAAKRPGVYVVSARSEVSLAGLSEASAQRLSVLGAADAAAGGAGCWLAACGTSVRGRAALVHRRAVVARDGLAAAAVLRGQAREDAWGVAAVAQDGPGLVWLFTGQGALRPGAGLGLVAAEPAFARAWREVCAAFAPYLPAGTPGLEAVLHGPDAARWLERASLAQPAHVGLGVALARLWRGRGVVPLVVLGHSLGEYVAAHVAGVLDLDGLARLVAGRGALCEGLAPGGMAATTAGAEEVEAVLAGLPGVLAGQASVAADHGVAGSTVAGSEAALGALCDALLARGHASERLAGGQGYHSPLVEPAMAGLAALARGVAHRAAEVALVSSWSGAVVGAGSDPTAYDWGEHWAGHLRGRVRYAQALAAAVRWAGGAGGGQGAQAASAAGIAAAAPAA
ncbi:type I polyketide synthase, partial [Roseomonas sp. CECT 9278]|uniref:type I polyketide synthase n=1 Tax=Roseomonas sp. CECT 9278 TaxID=2845823 RepID=UPI0027E11A04